MKRLQAPGNQRPPVIGSDADTEKGSDIRSIASSDVVTLHNAWRTAAWRSGPLFFPAFALPDNPIQKPDEGVYHLGTVFVCMLPISSIDVTWSHQASHEAAPHGAATLATYKETVEGELAVRF